MSSGLKPNKKEKVSWALTLISLIVDCGTMISGSVMAVSSNCRLK